MRKWIAGLSMLAGLYGGAHAATVASQFFPGFQQLSDNSAEMLLNATGGTRTLDVGDSLFGIFNIQTDEKAGFTTRNFGVAGVDELTGIFAIQVTGKEAFNGTTCFSTYCFTFGVSNAVLPILGTTLSAAYGANTLVALFDDSTPDFVREGCTLTDCVNSAKDGTPFWTLGFGANGFWTASAITDNIDTVGGIPSPGNGGTFNSALNFLTNNSGLNFGTVGCGVPPIQVGVCGSGSLLGTGGSTTPFDSYDNVDFTVNVVPEPSSIALAGLALLGLSAATRRRKS